MDKTENKQIKFKWNISKITNDDLTITYSGIDGDEIPNGATDIIVSYSDEYTNNISNSFLYFQPEGIVITNNSNSSNINISFGIDCSSEDYYSECIVTLGDFYNTNSKYISGEYIYVNNSSKYIYFNNNNIIKNGFSIKYEKIGECLELNNTLFDKYLLNNYSVNANDCAISIHGLLYITLNVSYNIKEDEPNENYEANGNTNKNPEDLLEPNTGNNLVISDDKIYYDINCKYDVSKCVFYIEDNEIKKFVISEIQMEIYKFGDNILYTIKSLIDTHGREHVNSSNLFVKRESIIDYISNQNTNENVYNILTFGVDYQLGQEVYAFLDNKAVNVIVSKIICTKTKSLVDFTISTKVEYILTEVGGSGTWTTEEIEVYNSKDDLINDINDNKLIYVGCDICDV